MASAENYTDDNGKNIIDVIDKKLEILTKEKEEIEKKYGIDENLLNSFSFNGMLPQFPPSLTQSIPKTSKINYENLTKIEEIKPKEIKSKYKTPENYIESLKYEPELKDVFDKETYEPTYISLNNLKSKPSNPKTYDITQFVDESTNEDYFNEILHE